MAQFRKRADGRYQTRVAIGGGEYKYVSGKTVKELNQKIADIKSKCNSGLNILAEADTFEKWGEIWLRNKERTVGYQTYATYKSRYKKLESVYDIPIAELRLVDIQELFYSLAEGEHRLSKKTLTGLKQDVIQIIQMAIDNRVLNYNCARAVLIPKSAKPAEHRRALTSEEQQWIINTPHRAQKAAMIMMFAGLRRGELLALKWSDIDLEEKTISITKSVEFIGNKPQVKQGGKTDAATRKVFIPDILVEFLRGCQPSKPDALVCPSARGSLMSEESWRRLWESYLAELNYHYGDFGKCVDDKGCPLTVKSKFQPGGLPFVIPRITAHWLRHTFITNMYLAGVSLLTAKDQAGHSDMHVTSEIYTHLDSEYKSRDMHSLNEYFAALGSKQANS